MHSKQCKCGLQHLKSYILWLLNSVANTVSQFCRSIGWTVAFMRQYCAECSFIMKQNSLEAGKVLKVYFMCCPIVLLWQCWLKLGRSRLRRKMGPSFCRGPAISILSDGFFVFPLLRSHWSSSDKKTIPYFFCTRGHPTQPHSTPCPWSPPH